jgi:hypothetical protein
MLKQKSGIHGRNPHLIAKKNGNHLIFSRRETIRIAKTNQQTKTR